RVFLRHRARRQCLPLAEASARCRLLLPLLGVGTLLGMGRPLVGLGRRRRIRRPPGRRTLALRDVCTDPAWWRGSVGEYQVTTGSRRASTSWTTVRGAAWRFAPSNRATGPGLRAPRPTPRGPAAGGPRRGEPFNRLLIGPKSAKFLAHSTRGPPPPAEE